MTINNVLNNANSFQLIATAVASNSAALTFTNLSADFFAYKLVLSQLITTSASNPSLTLQLSSNNGSTWNSIDYSMTYWDSGVPGFGQQSSTGNPSANISDTIDTNGACFGEIILINPSSATIKTTGNGNCSGDRTAAGVLPPWISAFRSSSASADNAVRLLMGVGNIASGTVKLYGLRA